MFNKTRNFTDTCMYTGDTIEKIASEKAGIFKVTYISMLANVGREVMPELCFSLISCYLIM